MIAYAEGMGWSTDLDLAGILKEYKRLSVYAMTVQAHMARVFHLWTMKSGASVVAHPETPHRTP